MIFLSGLSLMTINMSQYSHSNVLVNLSMVVKYHPVYSVDGGTGDCSEYV